MLAMWENLSDRERKLIAVFGLIVIVYVLYNSVISRSVQKLDDANATLYVLEERENTLNQEFANFQRMQREYGELEKEDVLVKLPENGEVPEIILWLEGVFAKPGISDPNFQFNIVNDEISYLEIAINFTGSSKGIYSVLREIENSERLVSVESTNISGSADIQSASISIRVYGQAF